MPQGEREMYTTCASQKPRQPPHLRPSPRCVASDSAISHGRPNLNPLEYRLPSDQRRPLDPVAYLPKSGKHSANGLLCVSECSVNLHPDENHACHSAISDRIGERESRKEAKRRGDLLRLSGRGLKGPETLFTDGCLRSL
jgi:hypothetical protein